MRKIYAYMTQDQKEQAVSLLKEDIKELQQEQLQQEQKGYPRVVRDAIEETIQRYTKDVEYLTNELKK
ncbi:hypothetical protein [Priestia filamentosa]|uniref:hypothetical protein n=1 Tax=Priestia filamentosa TaxID=1402861 RepID=UPI000E752128|nr:hypothetical protein [Priestia filamentosa]RJS62752.1 hypothetical protein CJ485_25535 [Priestia filamentosa]